MQAQPWGEDVSPEYVHMLVDVATHPEEVLHGQFFREGKRPDSSQETSQQDQKGQQQQPQEHHHHHQQQQQQQQQQQEQEQQQQEQEQEQQHKAKQQDGHQQPIGAAKVEGKERQTKMQDTELDEVLQRAKDFEQHTGMTSLDFIHSLSEPHLGTPEAQVDPPDPLAHPTSGAAEELQDVSEGLPSATVKAKERYLLLEALRAEMAEARGNTYKAASLMMHLKKLLGSIEATQKHTTGNPIVLESFQQQQVLRLLSKLRNATDAASEGIASTSGAFQFMYQGYPTPQLSSVQAYQEWIRSGLHTSSGQGNEHPNVYSSSDRSGPRGPESGRDDNPAAAAAAASASASAAGAAADGDNLDQGILRAIEATWNAVSSFLRIPSGLPKPRITTNTTSDTTSGTGANAATEHSADAPLHSPDGRPAEAVPHSIQPATTTAEATHRQMPHPAPAPRPHPILTTPSNWQLPLAPFPLKFPT
ncbi:hypothetical protein DUNSADRAFT_16757, partial [Dunaliella salina]